MAGACDDVSAVKPVIRLGPGTTMFGGTIKLTPAGVLVLAATLLLVLVYYARSGGSNDNKNKNVAAGESYEVSLRKLLALSLELAEKGGLAVKDVRESDKLGEKSKGKTKEGADELRTEADVRSHQIIVSGLLHLHPNLKIISEEHDVPPANLPEVPINYGADHDEMDHVPDQRVPLSDITVWVDPLDATQEFTENLLQYVTTMICIAVKGEPLIGIIHEPFKKNTVWGWVKRGSSKNLKAAAIDDHADKVRRIIVSRSHSGKVAKVAKQAFGNNTQIISAGGAGYKTLEVIRGDADAYIHVTMIKKWDVCAPNALLATLDGTMTTLDGTKLDYGAESHSTNKGGIIATLHHHSDYVSRLKHVNDNSQ